MIDLTIQVQPYALVLVVDLPTLLITACSDNAASFNWAAPEEVIGTSLHDHFAPRKVDKMLMSRGHSTPGVVKLSSDPKDEGRKLQAVIHHFAEELVLEIEECRNWPHPDDYSSRLGDFTRNLEDTATADALMQCLCDGIVYHLEYERAIMLQFDQQFNGLVTHEAKVADLPSFLEVHFTEDDVTARTRYNQLVDPVHNFSDVQQPMVGIVGSYGPSAREILRRHLGNRGLNDNFERFLLDNELTCIGYLSLIVGNELFGSLYFHSRQPIYLDYQMRTFLTVVGRVAQQKLSYHLYSRTLRMRQAANAIRDRLQEHIANSDNLAEGLTGGTTTLINLMEETHGAAICSDSELTLSGITPDQDTVDDIMRWIKQQHGGEELYHTDQLGLLYPTVRHLSATVAGILFLPLDVDANQWIIWFKPEVVQTIAYGSVAAEEDSDHSRRFYVHDDTRHGYSLPWETDDIGTALALQLFVQNVVMQRYASARRRNNLLQEAYADLEVFSYTVGHDLRAPLRGISSFAEILEEDFGKELGDVGLGHLRVIQENADRMRRFMSDLLKLSRVDRNSMVVNELSVTELVDRVLKDRATSDGHSFECVVQHDLPPIYGDQNQLVTVFTNLLSNAIKYSSEQEHPRVEVGFTGEYRNGHQIFFVSDNGIGIPADQHQRIFDLFTRSTNVGELQGTGIGLALVHRIIKFHDGEIWVESEAGQGSKFLFYTGVTA